MDPSTVIGIFETDDDLIAACRAAREKGLPIQDAHTPFAVHGLDEAMGLEPTRLGIVCFILGGVGLAVALGFQLWTSAWDWPMNVGGKSHSALPALIPITFELTILFAAMGTVLAIFWRARLWPGRKCRLPAVGITDDRFVLVLDCREGEIAAARDLIREHGGTEAPAEEAAG